MPHLLYCLNFPNGKKYLGLTDNIAARFYNHKNDARKGSPFLVHRAIKKYGFPPYQILCIGDREYIAALEIAAIAIFRTYDYQHGYNLGPGGDLSPSIVPETAAKISAALKGKPKSPEHRAKLSASGARRPVSPETLHLLATMNIGRPSALRGRKASPETRAKMSASHQGVLRGPYAPGTGAKISAALTGRKASPEARAKMSIAQSKRWLRERSSKP